jgi:hypothetical protein
MWVLFDPKNLEVKKTCLTKAEAKKWQSFENRKAWAWQTPLEIEQFEDGKLDQWLMLKMLKKE